MLIQRNCIICGVLFEANGRRFTCSPAHSREAIRRSRRRHEERRKKRKAERKKLARMSFPLPCLVCDKPIIQREHGPAIRLCSDNCKKQRAIDLGHASPPVVKVCKKCGVQFVGKFKYYCSEKCRPPKPLPRPRLTAEQREQSRQREAAQKHASWLQQKAARQIFQPY